jgi:predicted AAA+ superfamily ATPase
MKIEELERFNPWWKTGSTREELLRKYRRELFQDIASQMHTRQIVLVWGLRRVGKTTLMLQLIDSLLKSTKQLNILYFSLDEISIDLKDVLETYQKAILNKPFEALKERVYIFLDEVQKVSDWENKLKVYYDLNPNIKFIISGSASVRLRKKSKESLAGRITDFLMKPLSFKEFLEMSGKDVQKIRSSPNIWQREIIPLFYRYLKFGMFPELINEEDEESARNYILNNVVERVIYKDIPDEFGLKDVELIKSLYYMVGKNPGMILNYREISKNLGRDQRTIANYFEYLEFGLLLSFAFNYRGRPLASMRKMKKVYLTAPNITLAFNKFSDSLIPMMLENLVFLETNAKFFYRNSFEVDFILPEDDKLVAIEVKKAQKEIKQLTKFKKKFKNKVKEAIIVSMENESEVDGIKIIPCWKFLLGIK